LRGAEQSRNRSYQEGRKILPNQTEETVEANKQKGFRLSVDGWAVTVALIASFLVWIGWIKHIPW
jgi:hypothetical protein